MTPGIASLNPGLMSAQPFRAAGLHAGSVASHRGLVNPGETHAVGVRGEIGGDAYDDSRSALD